MLRKPLIFSLICTALTMAICVYAWINLPDLERFPLHWNMQGEPDRFGSREEVLLTLLIFPGVALFLTGLFYFIPRIEPLRDNLAQSFKAYAIVWMLTMALQVFVATLIALAYITDGGARLGGSPRLIVIALSLLFIGIGNVMGKVRQNFMFGIRTPWTLSSELSWEKTHRVGARLFVGGGVLSIIGALVAPHIAFHLFIAVAMAIAVISIVYSYLVWKGDPKKR